MIVLDIPTQTLNIALAGDSGSEENRQQIQDNVKSFAKKRGYMSEADADHLPDELMNDKTKEKRLTAAFTIES